MTTVPRLCSKGHICAAAHLTHVREKWGFLFKKGIDRLVPRKDGPLAAQGCDETAYFRLQWARTPNLQTSLAFGQLPDLSLRENRSRLITTGCARGPLARIRGWQARHLELCGWCAGGREAAMQGARGTVLPV